MDGGARLGEGGESECLMGTECQFGKVRVLETDGGGGYNSGGALNATELHP